jgi:hypothetical protein
MKLAAVVLAVTLCAALAACGGSSAPSRASYGKDVDRVCATLRARVAAIQRDEPQTPDEIAGFAQSLERAIDAGVRELRAVQRPDGADGEKAARWLDALQRENDDVVKPALTELEHAGRRGDTAAVRRAVERLQRSNSPQVDRLAREAGARDCD